MREWIRVRSTNDPLNYCVSGGEGHDFSVPWEHNPGSHNDGGAEAEQEGRLAVDVRFYH